MSEILNNEPGADDQPAKKQFYVMADDAGVAEIRISNDVVFALQVYIGIGKFISGQLRDAQTGEAPSLPQFLRDLGDMVEATERQLAANDSTPPEPEAA